MAQNPDYENFDNYDSYQDYDPNEDYANSAPMYEEDYGEDVDPEGCKCAPCECSCSSPNLKKKQMYGDALAGEYEGEDGMCTCDPCECETPPGTPLKTGEADVPEDSEAVEEEESSPYLLDEFTRAKAFFMKTSTKSGISLYDHLSDVIRKLLDRRAPKNAVDFIEEISMNVKRYRFQPPKDVLQDVFYISEPVLKDARFLTENWKNYAQWADEGKEIAGEGFVAGSFSNLLRLQYYLEQINVGLPREEMFRLALSIKDLTANRPFITRARFWGKVFGMRKNYYVVEAEINGPGSGDEDLWKPAEEESPPKEGGEKANENQAEEMLEGDQEEEALQETVPGAQETFEKAGNVVLNTEVLTAYSKTSGLAPDKQATMLPKPLSINQGNNNEWGGEDGQKPIDLQDADAAEDFAKWQGYKQELLGQFPVAPVEEVIEIPAEEDGNGVNRRVFYICNQFDQPWILLPPATPPQINGARQIRWGITGELDSNIRSFPNYPGKEGHFLKAMLTRASAGSFVSPKGFYKSGSFPSEFEGEDDEDIDEEEENENPTGDDKVVAVKKYRAQMDALGNPDLNFWVHHACPILPQGRNVWWNPQRGGKKKNADEDEETEDEDEEEGEGEDAEGKDMPKREVGPPLFTPISKDEAPDGKAAWTLVKSSSVFKEFQVLSVRSNTWPGSTVICTVKGKVDNIYLGDGQKFADRSYAPPMPVPTLTQYKSGPEWEEFPDPSVEEEQKWLNRLELEEIADIEPRFVDNEDGEEEEEFSDED